MSDVRFNAGDHLGKSVEFYAHAFRTIDTVHGPKKAAVADVYVGTGEDFREEFLNVLVFNVGIVKDLEAADNHELAGVLASVETKGRDADGKPYRAIVVK